LGAPARTTIFHNPRCSKSRETLELLRRNGVEPDVVEYLKTPPTAAGLIEILRKLRLRPRDVVRTKESVFASLHLDPDDDDAVIQALVAHPVLLERPIVVRGAAAAIGRPPERVLEIL
jgi:arsenate reductase (glutaredoxin)